MIYVLGSHCCVSHDHCAVWPLYPIPLVHFVNENSFHGSDLHNCAWTSCKCVLHTTRSSCIKMLTPLLCIMQISKYPSRTRLHKMFSTIGSINECTTRSCILVWFRLECYCVTEVEFRNIFLKIAAWISLLLTCSTKQTNVFYFLANCSPYHVSLWEFSFEKMTARSKSEFIQLILI